MKCNFIVTTALFSSPTDDLTPFQRFKPSSIGESYTTETRGRI